jgi:hypothetical protein
VTASLVAPPGRRSSSRSCHRAAAPGPAPAARPLRARAPPAAAPPISRLLAATVSGRTAAAAAARGASLSRPRIGTPARAAPVPPGPPSLQASAKLKDPNTKKATKITLAGDYVLHIMTNGSLAVGERVIGGV